MKQSDLPTIAAESNLHTANESTPPGCKVISGFAATQVRMNIARGDVQRELVSRALLAREEARRTGQYVSSDAMLSRLDASLVAARVRQIG